MSRVMRKPVFAYAKTKELISCAVNAQLISTYDFAINIVQSLYFLNRNAKPLAIFRGCSTQLVSDLVGNLEDRFSHDAALLSDIFML